ncbi:MAG TPA: hypothetical protein PKC76_10565 [Saprospiraceae bacterium]|nr:hypothetical protein [Saprospiraceae bacterium]HMP24566.1 hypothetical protein [Saprospiraceae bacterium]
MFNQTITAVLICAVCASCQQSPKDEYATPERVYTIEIYDSLQLQHSGMLLLSDYEDTKQMYLLYDYFGGDIIIANSKSEIIHQFNYKGDGKIGYNEIRGLSFLGANKIIAYGAYRYYIYEINGNFVASEDIFDKKLLVNPLYDFKAPHFYAPDSTLWLLVRGSTEDYGSPLYASFADAVNWISIYQPATQKIQTGVTIPSGSIYQKYYYYHIIPQIALNKEDGQVAVLYPAEARAYVYNLPALDLIQSVTLSSEYFIQPKGLPFSNDEDRMRINAFQEAQRAARYTTLQYLGNGMFMAYYRAGLPEERIVKDEKTYVETGLETYRNGYIQIFNEKGLYCQDIKLPAPTSGLYIATSMEHVVLAAETPEETAISKYYLARLTPVTN